MPEKNEAQTSIYGSGDKDTLDLLQRTEIRGRWLNLAAGDGRYNLILLSRADSVVDSDINAESLKKLEHNTPEALRSKLEVIAFDITERFPFDDASFDGVFCTGSLHQFKQEVLPSIFSEIGRILKPRGKVILDFATDISRITKEGKRIEFKDEPAYILDEARTLMQDILQGYRLEIYASKVVDHVEGATSYTFNCKFIIVVAVKP